MKNISFHKIILKIEVIIYENKKIMQLKIV